VNDHSSRRPKSFPYWRETFIEEPSLLARDLGTREPLRILGWMAVCERPPRYRAIDLGDQHSGQGDSACDRVDHAHTARRQMPARARESPATGVKGPSRIPDPFHQ
jgi:hypothetical protein